MTFGEELRRKYALTSLKTKGESLAVLAINETLETAARIAEEENAPIIAARIRNLKWADMAVASIPVSSIVPLGKSA
jgi:hypothetical protein